MMYLPSHKKKVRFGRPVAAVEDGRASAELYEFYESCRVVATASEKRNHAGCEAYRGTWGPQRGFSDMTRF